LIGTRLIESGFKSYVANGMEKRKIHKPVQNQTIINLTLCITLLYAGLLC